MYKPNFFCHHRRTRCWQNDIIGNVGTTRFPVRSRSGREIIREQMTHHSDALPWANIPAYTRLMFSRSVDSFKQHQDRKDILFFDRGIPDTLAYTYLTQQPVIPDLQHAVLSFRYNPLVFILPPWPEIYRTDSERKQTYQEAVETYDIMFDTYLQLGYSPVIVPKGPPEERANFIMKSLKFQDAHA